MLHAAPMAVKNGEHALMVSEHSMKHVRMALVGVGNVGRRLLELLVDRRELLRQDHGLEFSVHCLADSEGVAVSDSGFDLATLAEHKKAGGKVSDLATTTGRMTLPEALDRAHCDLLLEASPLNLESGDPGLTNSRAALERGLHLVLANKSPLALAHAELVQLARANNVGMLYSATFCGGLPVLNVIRRDMVCGKITRFRGIFNGTTNFILAELLAGNDYASALQTAFDVGAAEADPGLDVGGWDTAAKLVIAANQFCEPMITLADVAVTGIENVDAERLVDCRNESRALKLVASAEIVDGIWQFRVEPTAVPLDSFLGSCNGWEMGVEIESDIYGRSYYKLWEDEPVPTAASMLRDAVHLSTAGHRATTRDISSPVGD